MANFKLTTPVRNAMMDEITTYAGASAILKIMSGTQPAGGGAETTVLAQLTGDAVAWAASAAAGTILLNGVTADSSAAASGVATWFRWYQSDGSTWVCDGDISGIGGNGDMQLDNVNIVINATVSLSGPNQLTASDAA